MAVKRKNEKQKQKEDLMKNAVKIMCCYCDTRNDCKHRKSKEKTEALGIITYCTLTTNKRKSSSKSSK